MRSHVLPALLLLLLPAFAAAQEADAPPPVEIDRAARQVRVACEALRVDTPLEFVCVVTGTADHESLLRTRAAPSAVHAALLVLGLEPGRPLRFNDAAGEWLPPQGPPLRVFVEWVGPDGAVRRERVGRLIRDVRTKLSMPPRTFAFVGSRSYDAGGGLDGYAADATGQVVSLVNFDSPVIDVPQLASNANETLEWEIDPDAAPPQGTAVTMILEPVAAQAAATQPATRPGDDGVVDAPVDFQLVKIDREGRVLIEHEAVEVADLSRQLRAASDREEPRVRLSAPLGAPVAVVGTVIGELVAGGITDVTFVPPPEGAGAAASRPSPFGRQPQVVRVLDGGRQVSLGEGEGFGGSKPRPLGEFVADLQSRSGGGLGGGGGTGGGGGFGGETLQRGLPVLVRADANAADIRPVDLAAPAAALHVLGYGPVTVESPQAAAMSPADRTLAELREQWEASVLPQAQSLRTAAQTHYEAMRAYDAEINRLLDEAERLRRERDQLQARYDELTTPQPTLE